MSELETIAASIEAAKCPEDVFGLLPKDDELTELNAVFRRMSVVVHPDHYHASPDLREVATKAFARLTELLTEAKEKVGAKNYGDRTSNAHKIIAEPKRDPITVKVGKTEYIVMDTAFTGDVCTLYNASSVRATDDTTESGLLFKVVQHASDNDLVENEAKSLKTVFPATLAFESVHKEFRKYFVRPVDSFVLKSKTTNRRAIVLPRAPGYVPISEVRRAYPKGIDFRDMVWMFKRVISALGWLHEQGIVHGAVLPCHVLIHPVTHGAKIVDFSYSVPADGSQPIKAISGPNRRFYAPEVLSKGKPTPATDLYMAARCALELIDGHPGTPPRLTSFLQACTIANPRARSHDAWTLHDEFDDLLFNLVGKRRYRAFHMPNGSAST